MRRDLIVLFDWSLRGFSPLQEARWLAVSKWLMSVPISAINDVVALIFTPGIVCKLCNFVEYSFSQMASILSIHSCLCCSAKSISALSCRMMSMSHSETSVKPHVDSEITNITHWLSIVSYGRKKTFLRSRNWDNFIERFCIFDTLIKAR